MTSMTISLGQMDIKLGDPDVNLAKVATMTAEAARRGSDLVVFPELWSTGYDLENAGIHATPVNSTNKTSIFHQTAQLAQKHHIHILGSCLSDMGDGKHGNTAVWFTPDGNVLGHYSKIHLFQLMDEHHYLCGGNSPTLLETAWGKMGLAICYDLRFPELFRHYALAGANLVFLPSEWPHPRLAHWRTLLRARAIENQMFMVACNRVGITNDTSFFGHSTMLDPWGNIIVEAGESELLLTATIDLSLVETVRQKIPIFDDRRPELY